MPIESAFLRQARTDDPLEPGSEPTDSEDLKP